MTSQLEKRVSYSKTPIFEPIHPIHVEIKTNVIVVYVFLDAATLTEVFPCFSSVVRQMPGYN